MQPISIPLLRVEPYDQRAAILCETCVVEGHHHDSIYGSVSVHCTHSCCTAVPDAPAATSESEPELEPEPEQELPTGSLIGDESVDIDIGKGAFKQHDLSATTQLLDSSPNRVECVATSSENLDHTVYVFKVFRCVKSIAVALK